MTHSPMQFAWSTYNGERYFFGRANARQFDRATFARHLRDAHEMARIGRLRDAGAFMPKTRIDAIRMELDGLKYAPLGVNSAARRDALLAEETAELVAAFPRQRSAAASLIIAQVAADMRAAVNEVA